MKDLIIVDHIAIAGEKSVLIIKTKCQAIREVRTQILLVIQDIKKNNLGGNIIYRFVMLGED